jgi:hypothetical protein
LFVAAKHVETINVCGEGSSDARLWLRVKLLSMKQKRASAQRPRRAVLKETVNTL